jgi:hypothetical protein
VAELKARIDKRLRGMARDIAEELELLTGLKVESGEVVEKVDHDRLTELRAAVHRAIEVE